MTLKKIIEDRGLKNVFIAKQIGKSKATISSYINGYRIPKIETMQKLAEVLNVDLVTILACFYGEPKEVEI